MPDLILHLGSNLGNRSQNLARATQAIAHRIGSLYSQSAIYETAAWGKTDQPDFLNQALRLRTQLSPEDCLQICIQIEQELGRERIEHWGPRSIDIDLIAYSNRIIEQPDLVLPHPRLHLRGFVLVPLHDIIPDWQHPVFKKTVEKMLSECEDILSVMAWKTH